MVTAVSFVIKKSFCNRGEGAGWGLTRRSPSRLHHSCLCHAREAPHAVRNMQARAA